MNSRFPFPKRYLIYLIAVLTCSILLVVNIFRTDRWTGDKPFSEFAQQDWKLLFIFLIEEIILVVVMFWFVRLACRINKKRNAEITAQWEKDKYLGIIPGDFDYVWFDFSKTERALITIQKDKYKLYIQEHNERTGDWESFGGVSVYDSLASLKKALFYEFDFYCDENCVLDKHGDALYKEQ